MQDKILDMLMQKDEITWQSIIFDLVKSEQIDPWDVDISLLTQKYLEILNRLKETNFFISGKVVMAASLLLKIKSNKLLSEDITNFDALINPPEDDFFEADLFYQNQERINVDVPKLAIKTPQKRKRKVSVNDLIKALHKALEVNQRKVLRKIKEQSQRHPEIPKKTFDISSLIKEVFERIKNLFAKKEEITFTKIIPSESRDDKIKTFMPLLYLDHQNKINIFQEEHFGEIKIKMN
jgi:segregation and condensation protein A